MINSFRTFFHQPYPDPYVRQSSMWSALGVGVFIAAFLVLFAPFGMGNFPVPYRLFVAASFGAVTSVMTLLFNLLPGWFPSWFSFRRWSVGKQVGYYLLILAFIALGNALLSYSLGLMCDLLLGTASMVVETFMIGIFPVTFFVFFDFFRANQKYIREAKQLQQIAETHQVVATNPEQVMTEGTQLQLVGDNEGEVVALSANALLFIESEGNYCTVNYLHDSELRKEVLRCSLTRLVDQISAPSVIRCHRSFVVNLDRVISVEGNAAGYKLMLDGAGDYTVPVSRKYGPEVQQKMK